METIYTTTQFKSGQFITLENRNYVVNSSVDLQWLQLSDKPCFATVITFLKENTCIKK